MSVLSSIRIFEDDSAGRTSRYISGAGTLPARHSGGSIERFSKTSRAYQETGRIDASERDGNGQRSADLTMLKAGGSLRHKELLKPFGLDASKPDFWQSGMDVISGYIDQLGK